MVYCADGAPDIQHCQSNPRSVDLRPGGGGAAGRMETPHGGEQRRWRQLLGRPGRAERNPGRAECQRTERHLLRPYDVLVTARGDCVQAALVPRDVERMVASVTLLVVRTHRPEFGMGHYLWYFLTSAQGQAQLQRQLTVSPSVTSFVRQQPLRSKTVCPVGAKTEPDCQVGRGLRERLRCNPEGRPNRAGSHQGLDNRRGPIRPARPVHLGRFYDTHHPGTADQAVAGRRHPAGSDRLRRLQELHSSPCCS